MLVWYMSSLSPMSSKISPAVTLLKLLQPTFSFRVKYISSDDINPYNLIG